MCGLVYFRLQFGYLNCHFWLINYSERCKQFQSAWILVGNKISLSQFCLTMWHTSYSTRSINVNSLLKESTSNSTWIATSLEGWSLPKRRSRCENRMLYSNFIFMNKMPRLADSLMWQWGPGSGAKKFVFLMSRTENHRKQTSQQNVSCKSPKIHPFETTEFGHS